MKKNSRPYIWYGSYFELGDPIFKVGDRVTKYRSTFDNKLGNRWCTENFSSFKYSLY